jgi:hypothetical protein
MWNMATLIDVKKNKIGFGDGGEEIEVKMEKTADTDRLNRWHFSD